MFIQNNCQFPGQNIGNRVIWVLVPLYLYTLIPLYHFENLSSIAIWIKKVN
jgi:hypothetical protein